MIFSLILVAIILFCITFLIPILVCYEIDKKITIKTIKKIYTLLFKGING